MARHPTFRMNTDVRMRAGDEEIVIVEAVAEPVDDAPEAAPVVMPAAVDGWEPMATAPRDGMVVIVKPEASNMEARAMWRTSRRRDESARRWVPIGLWADPMSKTALGFEPAGWRHVPGFGPIYKGA
jgi:hypothetical protein